MKKFPLIFGCVIAILFVAFAIFAYRNASAGTRWLGDGIDNSSDIAVYFSYLRQGSDGHVLLRNLYSVEPNRSRFDLFWSTLGQITRLGFDPIIVHEDARAVLIIILVIALWHAARSVLKNDRDANLATVLVVGGIGTGWIYSIWLGAAQMWTPQTYAAPDIVTEFALGPILFGGAHVILSVALLITSIRWIWRGLTGLRRRDIVFGSIIGLFLLAFHPYFTPLLFVIGCLAVASRWSDRAKRRKRLLWFAVALLILAPSILYYAWLLTDPVFAMHHLQDNILPLSPAPVWLLTLLPFIVAFMWMWRAKKLPHHLDWTSAWIIAACICLVGLPVPWLRKLTEGLIVPMVLLTMPAWIAVRDWLARQQPMFMRMLLTILLLIAAYLGPIHIAISQLAWLTRPDAQPYFYQPEALFRVANTIADQPNAILLSDDRWADVWLPAITGKRVWIGHDHETPDFDTKQNIYRTLLETNDSRIAQSILKNADVTAFITTSATSTARFAQLLTPTWHVAASSGEITGWIRY